MLRSQSIVDREPGKSRLAERLEQRLDVGLFVPAHEPAAMNQDARRKWPGSLRNERIQCEADIADLGKLDVGLEERDGWFRSICDGQELQQEDE